MRRLSLLPIAIVLSAAAAAQSLDHVRIEGVPNAAEFAVELEQAGYTVVEGGVTGTSIELHVVPAETAALEAMGYVPVLISVGRPYQEIQEEYFAASAGMVPVGYPTLAEIEAQLLDVEAAFPSIAKVVNLTQTYGAPLTHDGNELYALKISDNVDLEEDEPSMFIMCNHHSNEIGTAVVGLTAIDELTANYASDPAIRAIVDANEIFIAPVWNPDGLDYVHFVNNNWRKNRRDNGNGTFGVDLNRNYGAGWTAPCSGSSSTSSGNYKGPAAFSEPESQTCQLFTADQRFARVIEYHSAGRETLWEFNCTVHPWGTSFMLPSAILLSQASGYGNAERPPSAEGEHYQWQFTIGAWSHLVEIGASQQPSYASALAEADQLFGGIQWMLEQPFRFSGHVTDACSGAPVEADINFHGVVIPYGGTFSSTPDFGRYDLMPRLGNYSVAFSAPGYATLNVPVSIAAGTPVVLDVALVPNAPAAVSYCTAGTSVSGCQATLSSAGTASASAASGFVVTGASVEGQTSGQFYFGTSGQQATPWGNGTSFRCVAPPTKRGGILAAGGTSGACDGVIAQDLAALWTAKPHTNPGSGTLVQLQLWYRDPFSTSNQTTSFSDALEFGVCP